MRIQHVTTMQKPPIYISPTSPFCYPTLDLFFYILKEKKMQPQPRHEQQLSRQVAKTTTAVTVGGSLMVLSGLTLAATVVGLAIATPLLVIFSPVLVPAVITLGLILGGFLASGGFGATASFVFYWMYRYVTGKHPIGATKIDYARDKIAYAAHDVKEKAEQLGQQAQQQIKS